MLFISNHQPTVNANNAGIALKVKLRYLINRGKFIGHDSQAEEVAEKIRGGFALFKTY